MLKGKDKNYLKGKVMQIIGVQEGQSLQGFLQDKKDMMIIFDDINKIPTSIKRESREVFQLLIKSQVKLVVTSRKAKIPIKNMFP